MRYQTILTVVSQPQDIETMLLSAAPFAQENDAHLEVLCLGIDQTQTGYYFAGASAMAHDEGRQEAQANAQALCDSCEEGLHRLGIRFSCQPAIVQPATMTHFVSELAQFADLVILPPPYAPGRADHAATLVEAALFGGRTAVLITDKPVPQPDRAVLAWNQSPEALAAARAALPMMINARRTDVLIIDPPRHNATHGDPGTNISTMLARHGATPSVVIEVQTLPRVSDSILRHMRDIEAGLLVMGAYGHSRLREAILGGATRRMLEQSEVPVLLAH